MGKNTVVTLRQMKERGEKISQVTCYDYSMARLVDAAGINMILVGDSLGMTMQGYKDTLPVTVDEMIIYGRSVVRSMEAEGLKAVIQAPTPDVPSVAKAIEEYLKNYC